MCVYVYMCMSLCGVYVLVCVRESDCCRPYSKPEGRGTESGMESRSAESAMMGSGLRKGVRQRSFFEDEYSTVTGEVYTMTVQNMYVT